MFLMNTHIPVWKGKTNMASWDGSWEDMIQNWRSKTVVATEITVCFYYKKQHGIKPKDLFPANIATLKDNVNSKY